MWVILKLLSMGNGEQLGLVVLGLAVGLLLGYLFWKGPNVEDLCFGTGNSAAADLSFVDGINPYLEERMADIISDNCLDNIELYE